MFQLYERAWVQPLLQLKFLEQVPLPFCDVISAHSIVVHDGHGDDDVIHSIPIITLILDEHDDGGDVSQQVLIQQ